MRTLGDQAKAFRESRGWNSKQMADYVGTSRQNIESLELHGNRIPKYLGKLAAAMGRSVDEVLAEADLSPRGAAASLMIDLDAHPDLSPIRKVRLKLQAGINGFAVEPDDAEGPPIFFRAEWMAHRSFKPYDLLAIKVRGESMEPSLHDGDLVVINTADVVPKDGEVFAINYEGEAVIKRLVRDGGEWWLASDNTDQRRYPRKRWVDGDSLIVGRVVHKQSERI